MSALTDLTSITLTATARNAGHKAGVNLAALLDNAKLKAVELARLLTIISALHPTTGSDAANSAELAIIIAELA
jgi:hypothetical protein